MAYTAAAQRQYDNQHDAEGEAQDAANEARAEAIAGILADPDQLADIDETASQDLLGDEFTALFSVLADMSDCGAVARLAEGTPADAMNAAQLAVFARFARLADRISDVRAHAVRQAVRS